MALAPDQNQSLLDRVSAEVAPETSPLLRFLLDNARTIAIAVAVVLLAAVGYGVYSWYQKGQLEEANNELGRIILVQDAAQRLSALAAYRDKAPSDLKMAVELALAKAAVDAGDHAAAEQSWDRILQGSDASLAFVAGMGKAQAQALQDKNAEALKTLEALNPNASEARYLRDKAMADLAERMGDISRAVAMYEELAKGNANPSEAEFLRQKAASLKEQQQTADAG